MKPKPVITRYPLIILIFSSLALLPISAQENAWYYTLDTTFRLADEAYQKGNYAMSRALFGAFLHSLKKAEKDAPELIKTEAAYKEAASAKYLENEDADELLLSFIEKYGNDRYYNSLANFQLGNLYYSKKSYSSALSCFEQVHPSDLDKPAYHAYFFYRAYSYFNIKKFDEAYPLFDQVTRMHGPYAPDAHYYMGFIAFAREDYPLAENHFNQIEDSEKYKAIIPYYMSQIYFVQKNYDKVISYAAPKMKIKELKYKKETGYILGQSYYRGEKFKEALPYLKAYVDNSAKVRKEDLYQLAYTQYRFEQYEEAIKNFSELNTLQDSLGQNAMYHLADCYLRKNDKQKAQNSFYDAAKLEYDPIIQEVSHFNYAKLAFELQQDRAALHSLQEFISKWPKSLRLPEAKDLLASVILQTLNYNEGITILESINDPSDKMKGAYQRMCYYKGLDMYNDNRRTEAEQFLDKALRYPQDKAMADYCQYWKGQIAYERNDYADTEDKMNLFINSNTGKSDLRANLSTAFYTSAYCAFSKKEYNRASKLFDQCLESFDEGIPLEWHKDEQINRLYSDALMRSADSRFLQKDYSGAKKLYERAIKIKVLDADYASYQTGIIAGLMNDNKQKSEILGNLPTAFPGSLFGDDALFQKAIAQTFSDDLEGAIRTHLRITTEYRESVYYRKSLAELGLLSFNLSKYGEARKYYDEVIREFPESAEAQSAIAGMKEVFLAEANYSGYKTYLQNHPEVEMSASKADSTMYQFAENTFEKRQYNKSIEEFTLYLKEFPRGIFKNNAYYYRGEAYYQNKKYEEAKEDFEKVAAKDNNVFYGSALEKLGNISFFIDKDYNSSYKYLLSRYSRSSTPEEALQALRGLIVSVYELKKNAEVEKYGQKLLDHPLATRDDKADAHYYVGRSAVGHNPAKAKAHLEQLALMSTNERGAEARYYLAEILYKQGAYDEARKACMRTDKETPNQEFWVVKSFLLMAETDIEKGDLLQAKATLKSILDYYEGDATLKQQVQEKYDETIRAINARSKLETSSENLLIEENEPEEKSNDE